MRRVRFLLLRAGAISLQTALLNIARIPVNYGTEVGHLWFVYMADGDLPCRACVLTVDRFGKPEERGALPGAVGHHTVAALHSPLRLRGMGRVLLECNANPLLLLRLHRLPYSPLISSDSGWRLRCVSIGSQSAWLLQATPLPLRMACSEAAGMAHWDSRVQRDSASWIDVRTLPNPLLADLNKSWA